MIGTTRDDEATFAALSERHRRELHMYCYRMLASFDEAEDAVRRVRKWSELAALDQRDVHRDAHGAIGGGERRQVLGQAVAQRCARSARHIDSALVGESGEQPLDAVEAGDVGDAPLPPPHRR